MRSARAHKNAITSPRLTRLPVTRKPLVTKNTSTAISASDRPRWSKKNSRDDGSPSTATLWPASTESAAVRRIRLKLLSRPPAPTAGRRLGPAAARLSFRRPDRPFGLGEALRLQKIGDHERHLDRLLRIEARIAIGVIAIVQIGLRNGARAAGAFGDVLTRHLEMDAAGVNAFCAADGEEVAHLMGDALGRPRLKTARGFDRIAVHRV